MKKSLLLILFSTISFLTSYSQLTATDYYNSALINDSLKDYPAAIHDLDNALIQNPVFDSAYCMLGNIEMKQGEFKIAIKLNK